MRRLIDAGILTERSIGRTRLIKANEASPLVPPLAEMLRISAGPVPLLTRELSHIDGIESAFLYGSVAARILAVEGASPHDVDLIVVGSPDPEEVYDACSRVEELVHRPVNAAILTAEELRGDSGFLENVRASPVVPVVGDIPWR